MKGLFPCLLAAALGGGAIALSGCAMSCGASEQKLMALRPGMTYAETTQVMGCPGAAVTQSPASADFATYEWDGPKDPFFTRTRMLFQDGRLLSFVSRKRGAL